MNKRNSAPDSGALSPEKESKVAAIYAFADSTVENSNTPEPEKPEEEPAIPVTPQPPKPLGNPIADRLLERLNKTSKRIDLKVNGVEFDVPVIDVQISESSICCLLKDNGWNCKIPPTRDVILTVDDIKHPVVFLGSWHRFEWLGAHILFFPKLDEPEAGG